MKDNLKVHFIASVLNIEANESIYRRIFAAIQSTQATVVHEWIDEELKELNEPIVGYDPKLWSSTYENTIDYVHRSDLIIAEVTNRSFFVGFQVALALSLKKPILILCKEDLRSFKGVDEAEDIVKFATYNDDNLQDHVSEFINEYKDGAKSVRFNFFIDRKGLNYLNLTAINTGETKAQVIRRLLEEDMHKK